MLLQSKKFSYDTYLITYWVNYFCWHCTITVSYVHWIIESHNLSLEVVFLFRSFLVLTVDKHFLWFYHETWTDCSRDSIYLLICWYAVCGLSCHIKTTIFIIVWIDWSQAICIRTNRDIYTCIMYPETLGESLIFHLILVSLKGLKLEKQKNKWTENNWIKNKTNLTLYIFRLKGTVLVISSDLSFQKV